MRPTYFDTIAWDNSQVPYSFEVFPTDESSNFVSTAVIPSPAAAVQSASLWDASSEQYSVVAVIFFYSF